MLLCGPSRGCCAAETSRPRGCRHLTLAAQLHTVTPFHFRELGRTLPHLSNKARHHTASQMSNRLLKQQLAAFLAGGEGTSGGSGGGSGTAKGRGGASKNKKASSSSSSSGLEASSKTNKATAAKRRRENKRKVGMLHPSLACQPPFHLLWGKNASSLPVFPEASPLRSSFNCEGEGVQEEVIGGSQQPREEPEPAQVYVRPSIGGKEAPREGTVGRSSGGIPYY